MLRALFAVALFVVVGCSANLPDGRFRCDIDTPCPSGLTCSGHLCYHPGTAPDASESPDGGGVDAGRDADIPADMGLPTDAGPGLDTGLDAGAIDGGSDASADAGPCTASDCITLTITNAYGPTAAGLTFTVEGRTVTMPMFGETTTAFDVALGGDGHLDVGSALLGTLSLMASGHASYALVIGHASTGGVMPNVRLLLESSVGGTGMMFIRPIDMMQDTSVLTLIDPVPTARDLSPTVDPGVLIYTSGQRDPMLLRRSISEGSTLLAAFDPNDLPQMGGYYLILVGRTDTHLGAADGLRAIAVVPGMHIVPSRPIVFALNATDQKINVCDGTTLLTVVNQAAVSTAFPSFGRGTPTGELRHITLTDTSAPTACDGTGPTRGVLLPMPTVAEPSGRILLAAIGSIGSSMWGGGASLEAPVDTTGAEQLVTYGNGTLSGDLRFGSGAAGFVATAPALGAVSYAWPAIPSDLRVDYGALGMKAFSWGPMTSTAAVLAVTDGSNFYAYELDTPYGQDWTLSVKIAP